MINALSWTIRRLFCQMRSHMHSPSCILLFFSIAILVFFNHFRKSEARDSINAKSPLSNRGDTLVSAGNRFELGFFTAQEKSNRSYVGIWYYGVTPKTVVWVANRDNPLSASCGFFGIAEDGNVELWCSDGRVRFPVTSLESSKHFNRTVQLLDTGNLLLYDGQSGTRLWQSFDHPTDTFLPGMKMDSNMVLTSWVNPTDPGTGDYTFKQDRGVYTIQNRSNDYWRSGEPMFPIHDEVPPFVLQTLKGSEQEEYEPLMKRANSTYISYNYTRSSNYSTARLLMNSSGEIQYYIYSSADGRWGSLWSRPNDPCSVYNPCGKFAICRLEKVPICHCLHGYKLTSSLESWGPGPNTDGCDRQLKCSLGDRRKDSFLNKSFVKVGGDARIYERAKNDTACKDECSNNCKCTAYLYIRTNVRERGSPYSAGNCLIWTSDLVNLQDDDNNGGQKLFIRVPFYPTGDLSLPSEQTCDSSADCNDWPNSECEDRGNGERRCYCKLGYQWESSSVNCTLASTELGKDSRRPKNKFPVRYVIALTVLLAGVTLVSCTSYILYQKRRMTIRTGNTEANPVLFPNGSERQASDMMQENNSGIDVPLYSFDTILYATDNFSAANKLGQGGFGPVYKGTFPGGREIAVKRLSSCSGQGVDEFLNEVFLIAKLQHRNLVKLLGYCIKETEKILLYEYMPNRSLDAFIFDQNNCLLVDWKKRFDIILGIARGLLYLHQDSRLRIVHRDLKTSNILLDEEMNPKISDFGLARIVQGKGTEASTNKVVGTYGYMSPEYALDGKFSIKSDVFSFGVVMLEIISGKRNKDFYNPHEVLNLLGYAWRLWTENKALDLVHPTLVLEHDDKSQVTKCINVGLLCVQEDPNERPSMSTVVIMLGSEMSVPLPSPTQPAFVMRTRDSSTASSSSTKQDTVSYNKLTLSMEQGR